MFLNREQLATAVANTKQDFASVRGIADETQRKIAALDCRQYSEAYVREQAAAIRHEAAMKVSQLLLKNSVAVRTTQVVSAAPHWTVKKFLTRARMTKAQRHTIAETGRPEATLADVLEELSVLRWTATVQKLGVDSLSDTLDEAIAVNSWGIVSEIWTEVNSRRASGDQSADLSQLSARLQSIQLPEVTEAQALIAEHAQLSELLGYAQRGVTEGVQSDIGRGMSEAIRIRQERDAARAEQQRGH